MKAETTNTRVPYRVKNIVGEKFGRLTVVKFAGVNKFEFATWSCRCECGTEIIVIGSSLRSGHTKSCGCFSSDVRPLCAAVHGGCFDGTTEPEYYCWQGMMKRCFNKSHKSYAFYGGSGISVSQEFRDYLKFKEYIGPRPSTNHSVDRFPNRTGNYERGNIRWATRSQQQRNMKSNRLLTLDGKTMTMIEWAQAKGMNYKTLKSRKHFGWSDEDALLTPIKKSGK